MLIINLMLRWCLLQAGGLCFESAEDINFETSQLYRVAFGVSMANLDILHN